MDTFAEAMPQSHTAAVVYSDLKKPPKWMRKPVGAVFGVSEMVSFICQQIFENFVFDFVFSLVVN